MKFDITNYQTYKWYHKLLRRWYIIYGTFFLYIFSYKLMYKNTFWNVIQTWILTQAGYSRHPLVEYYYHN